MVADAEILDHVNPSKPAEVLHGGRDEHAPIEAAATGVESLQAINGGRRIRGASQMLIMDQ